MAINSFPSQAGGGQANLNYIGSVHMETFNRRWAQSGGAGYYALYSTNQENGYAYFVGTGTSTGAPLNRLVSVTHDFTRIDIIAPTNDMISLYKAEVKSTAVFPNPFDADNTIGKLAISSFPSIISSSGNFVLPNNALPLVNVLLVGSGGSAFHHGGGGGGGGVVKLTAYQAVGTTAVSIGSHVNGNGGTNGNPTYFGNVYALGGGSAGTDSNSNGNAGGNGGGASAHSQGTTYQGGAATIQTASTGLGSTGTPTQHGNRGGNAYQPGGHHIGGGGGGAGGAGPDRINVRGGYHGGAGHLSDISGSNTHYGAGGPSADHHQNSSSGNPSQDFAHTSAIGFGHGGRSRFNSHDSSGNGGVVVRYYIP